MPDSVGLAAAVLRRHERLWRSALALSDLLHRPSGRDRTILLEDIIAFALLGVFVAMLDQKPVGALAAGAVMAHAHQHPASVQLVALKREFEVAFPEAGFGIITIPIAAIPELHGAAAILALRDRAFEVAVVERMILDFDGEPLVMRVERRAAGHRPRLEDAVEFEPQIVVQPGCGMLLDDEPPPTRRRDPDIARGLLGLLEIPLLPVGGQLSGRHDRTHQLNRASLT